MLKSVLHVQHAYISSLSQSDHSFIALSLPLPSSILNLPGTQILEFDWRRPGDPGVPDNTMRTPSYGPLRQFIYLELVKPFFSYLKQLERYDAQKYIICTKVDSGSGSFHSESGERESFEENLNIMNTAAT